MFNKVVMLCTYHISSLQRERCTRKWKYNARSFRLGYSVEAN